MLVLETAIRIVVALVTPAASITPWNNVIESIEQYRSYIQISAIPQQPALVVQTQFSRAGHNCFGDIQHLQGSFQDFMEEKSPMKHIQHIQIKSIPPYTFLLLPSSLSPLSLSSKGGCHQRCPALPIPGPGYTPALEMT